MTFVIFTYLKLVNIMWEMLVIIVPHDEKYYLH